MREYSIQELKEIICKYRGRIDRVYLHWTAGKYGQYFSDYHINIDDDGKIFMPSDNLLICRYHTWRRNSEAVGIAVCACYGAQAKNGINADFGDYPVTEKQIETMSIIVALFRKYGGVSLNDVLTHCEIAYEDGYGPYSGDEETRWDLWYLPDNAYAGKMRGGGEVIRGKARWYLENAKL